MTGVFFDLDGTLLRFERGYREILADTFRSVAGECREEWLGAYDSAFFEAFDAFEPDPYRRAFAAAGTRADPDRLAATLLEHELAACRPPDDAHATLRRLAESHRLGVLTNGVPAWQRRKLRAHDLREYFDAVVVSYEVGAHKPDPAPFRAAERYLPAEAYVMVGDGAADVDGARNAGWSAYRYRGDGFGALPETFE